MDAPFPWPSVALLPDYAAALSNRSHRPPLRGSAASHCRLTHVVRDTNRRTVLHSTVSAARVVTPESDRSAARCAQTTGTDDKHGARSRACPHPCDLLSPSHGSHHLALAAFPLLLSRSAVPDRVLLEAFSQVIPVRYRRPGFGNRRFRRLAAEAGTESMTEAS